MDAATFTASWLDTDGSTVLARTYADREVAAAVARAAESGGRKMVRLFDDSTGVDLLAAAETWDELAPA